MTRLSSFTLMRALHRFCPVLVFLVVIVLAACKGGDSSSPVFDTAQYRWIDADGPSSQADTLLD